MTTNRGDENKKVASSRWGRRRMYGGLAGWTVAAAAASGLGLAAVSLLGNDLGTGAVAYADTAGGASVTGVSTSTVQSRQQADWTAGLYSTRGGQIIARCSSLVPSVTVVPAAGWVVRQADRRSGTEAEVTLTSGRDRIEVHIGCAATGPTFNAEGVTTSTSRTAPTTTRTPTTTRPVTTTSDDHGRGAEPGDDHGSSAATATSTGADDRGGKATEPGDDNGGRGAEAGDDNGGRATEPGDDRSATSTTSSAPSTTTARSTSSNRPTSATSSSSNGRGGSSSSSSSSRSSSSSSSSSTSAGKTEDNGSGRGKSGGGGGDDN